MFEFRGFITSYEDVDERFEQSIRWNNHTVREIDVPKSDYTIFSMGDSHVGSTKNLDTFFKKAMNENAATSVLVGDLTTGHKEDYDVFLEHLPVRESLEYFAVAGNHDLYFGGWQYFYSIFGSSSYYFLVNTPTASDMFICLDSGGGTLGDKQIEWFENLLMTKRKNYRNCIVFTHNNIFRFRPTVIANPMVEEIQVLVDLLIRYNVNMLVTAHDHKRNTDIFGNTIYITMDALEDSNDNASYLKIHVDDENINYSFVKL